MEDDLRFDIALSYAEKDAWIAKDLYQLATGYGFSVFCADYLPDRASGFLRTKLQEIYSESRLNVVLWSQAYSSKSIDSFPALERRAIAARHVGRGEADSLLPVVIDDAPLERDFQEVLAHKLTREGITGVLKIILSRLRLLSSKATPHGRIQHPPGTDAVRGTLHPCSFSIDPNYERDRLGRWAKLADVLVDFHNPLHTRFVYLIPSGLTTPWLRHSKILSTEPDLLERKRKLTQSFASKFIGRRLDGFWFAMRKPELEIATVYCPEYDVFLNRSFQERPDEG